MEKNETPTFYAKGRILKKKQMQEMQIKQEEKQKQELENQKTHKMKNMDLPPPEQLEQPEEIDEGQKNFMPVIRKVDKNRQKVYKCPRHPDKKAKFYDISTIEELFCSKCVLEMVVDKDFNNNMSKEGNPLVPKYQNLRKRKKLKNFQKIWRF